jgi:alpha/beta superfamily hydrolase
MSKVLVLLMFIANGAFAQILPDYDKESRWASFIEDGLMDGDVVWIKNAEREFLSIFTESESESDKVAVVLHGLGVHPDWTEVIQPLRIALTEQGYHTLSIQLPVLANGVPGTEYNSIWPDSDQRIIASISYIEGLGKSAELIIAHSHGTRMARHYLAGHPQHPFKKMVAIGMGGASGLSDINIPILDLYGTEDLDSVLTTVKQRRDASKHNAEYMQKQIQGDHFFNNQNELLTKTVSAWLQ